MRSAVTMLAVAYDRLIAAVFFHLAFFASSNQASRAAFDAAGCLGNLATLSDQPPPHPRR
jgi:hypothetical protein